MFTLLFASLTFSVDRAKYRTCNQSRFCGRNRHVPPQHWTVNKGSELLTFGVFEALVNDTTWNTTLRLRVLNLACGGVRVRLEPVLGDPLFRFDLSLESTVIDPLELATFRRIGMSLNYTHIALMLQGPRLDIQYDPFLMVLTSAAGRRMTLNADDNAIFESRRNRTSHPSLFRGVNLSGTNDTIKNGPTAVAFDVEFHAHGARLSGLPSHTLPFTLPQTVGSSDPIRFWNTDVNRYELENGMSMYGSIPFLLARSSTGTEGVFWANPSETWVDLTTQKRRKARFISEGGYIDVYLFAGSPRDVVNGFTRLTGRPQLLPYFAFGFHQCRWGYGSDKEVKSVSARLDEHDVPHDVLWLDLDYTDNHRYFYFDHGRFPNPEEFQDHFEAAKRKVVILVDPHLKTDNSYGHYTASKEKGILLRNADNETHEGECWPGRSVWPDFLHPEGRSWWEDQFTFSTFPRSRPNLYIWNDMNEISMFDGPEGTAPRDLLHYGGFEEREVHNIYGHLMVASTFAGLINRDTKRNSRPFVLTRSFFAGSQKFAGTWTGDNTGNWAHLRASIPMIFSYAVAGMVFTGADVGGFFDSPDANLLARWYQIGAWLYPFFRCHCHRDSAYREVYTLKGDARAVAQEAVHDRYRLLPYWYTLGRYANLTGEPIVRPVWWEFPDDQWIDVEDKAMVGSALFVVPFLRDVGALRIVFPAGAKWFNWRTLREVAGTNISVKEDGGRTPVFIRGGSVVPTKQRIRRSATLMFYDPFTIVVAADADGKAEGELYVDDGESFDFANGQFIHRKFILEGDQFMSVEVGRMGTGKFAKGYDVVIEQIRLTGLRRTPTHVVDGAGNEMNVTVDDGVIVLRKLKLMVRENFTLAFKYSNTD